MKEIKFSSDNKWAHVKSKDNGVTWTVLYGEKDRGLCNKEDAKCKIHAMQIADRFVNGEFDTLNEWWLSLPKERQQILIEDKWMLANAAFEAGKGQRLG